MAWILPAGPGPLWPRMVRTVFCLRQSQTRMTLSSEAETRSLPSGVKTTLWILAMCPPESSWRIGPSLLFFSRCAALKGCRSSATVSVCSRPPRNSLSFTLAPGSLSPMPATKRSLFSTSRPSTEMITSWARMPARAAGPLARGLITFTPRGASQPS